MEDTVNKEGAGGAPSPRAFSFAFWALAASSVVAIAIARVNSVLSHLQTNEDITMTNKTQLFSLQQDCDERLDALDNFFDARREARKDSPPTIDCEKNCYDLFEPEAVCFTDERFGSGTRFKSFGDGPKFVCGVDYIATKLSRKNDDKEGRCLVYSVGSNNQIDFEKSVKKYLGCEVHTFDPTLKRPFVGDEYAQFHPWGLGIDGVNSTANGKTWTGKSFATIFKELGHISQTIDILKIDCEGCEYSTLPPLFDNIASGMIHVNQLQIELHGTKYENIANFFESADKAKMRIFHKERNQWGCNGYTCVEYALASENFLREANRAVICPALDGSHHIGLYHPKKSDSSDNETQQLR